MIIHKYLSHSICTPCKILEIQQLWRKWSARFGSTYTKIGTIQRRLAWPLRKDDTQIREAFHIFDEKKKEKREEKKNKSLGTYKAKKKKENENDLDLVLEWRLLLTAVLLPLFPRFLTVEVEKYKPHELPTRPWRSQVAESGFEPGALTEPIPPGCWEV